MSTPCVPPTASCAPPAAASSQATAVAPSGARAAPESSRKLPSSCRGAPAGTAHNSNSPLVSREAAIGCWGCWARAVIGAAWPVWRCRVRECSGSSCTMARGWLPAEMPAGACGDMLSQTGLGSLARSAAQCPEAESCLIARGMLPAETPAGSNEEAQRHTGSARRRGLESMLL